MLKRAMKTIAVVGLLMALITVAAWWLASQDKRPKDHRYMVRLEVGR